MIESALQRQEKPRNIFTPLRFEEEGELVPIELILGVYDLHREAAVVNFCLANAKDLSLLLRLYIRRWRGMEEIVWQANGRAGDTREGNDEHDEKDRSTN